MRTLRRGWSRLVGTFSGRRCDHDAAAELESHLQMQMEDNLRLGMSPEDARRAAILKLGGLEATKESLRDQRGLPRLESFAADIRHAGRGLRRNPGFATAAILTLALGIGANTAIFSVIHSVLLKPLPYADPEELYAVEIVIPERTAQFASLPVTIQAYLEWRSADTVFDQMAALRPWECNLTGDGEPERLGGARVSADFFPVLGVPLAHGPGFSDEHERPGNERVVVISNALWRRRYAADPSVVGRSIDINGEAHRVVGITPPSLLVPTGTQLHALVPFASRVDLWKPIAPTPRDLEGESWDHGVIVRLPPGESLEQGRVELQALLNALIRAQVPGADMEVIAQLRPLREVFSGKARPALLLLLAAATLLLLTACTNIANLFLARVASRASELATRIALGASRGRILSQTLAESLLVASIGGALGAFLAKFAARALVALGPDDVKLLADVRLNAPVLLFAIGASFATGIACGIFPAWQSYRRDAATDLQDAARAALGGRRAGRLRQALVVVEMTLCTALLASASLLLHSFANVMRADRGYQIERVLAVDLSLFGQRYSGTDSRVEFYRSASEKVRALPGVSAAGAISDLPAVSGSVGASQTIFYPEDTDFQKVVLARPVAMIRSVTAGYFAASGTPLRAGRFFTEQEQGLVAVVSESLARSLWPGEPPEGAVGRSLKQGDVRRPLIEVVGVVADVLPGAADHALPPFIYRPHGQWASGPMTLIVRTDREPASLAAPVRAEIREMDSNLPIPAVRTMHEIVSTSVAQRRFQMLLISFFALAAMMLGAVGVYGVVNYSVACRTREAGVRLALGAVQSDILRWIFSQGMRPAVFGLVAGMAGAIGIAQALRSLLFGVAPTDPAALGGVALILLCTSAVACYLPARRASRLDPLAALRQE